MRLIERCRSRSVLAFASPHGPSLGRDAMASGCDDLGVLDFDENMFIVPLIPFLKTVIIPRRNSMRNIIVTMRSKFILRPHTAASIFE